MAHTYYVPVAPHCVVSPIGTMASCHVCAAVPNFLVLEWHWIQRLELWRSFVQEGEIIDKGFITLPDRPGIGVEMNEEAARQGAGARHAMVRSARRHAMTSCVRARWWGVAIVMVAVAVARARVAAAGGPAADRAARRSALAGFSRSTVASVSDAVDQVIGRRGYLAHDVRRTSRGTFVGRARQRLSRPAPPEQGDAGARR